MAIKDIEKQNLEAHVELCAVRYNQLHDKFDAVNHRLDKQEAMLQEIRHAVMSQNDNRNRQLLAWGATLITLLVTATGSLLFMILK